jgi:hypothetical protein
MIRSRRLFFAERPLRNEIAARLRQWLRVLDEEQQDKR